MLETAWESRWPPIKKKITLEIRILLLEDYQKKTREIKLIFTA